MGKDIVLSRKLNDNNFYNLLQSAEDITHRYDIDLGGLPDDILSATQLVSPLIREVRRRMESLVLHPDIDLTDIETGLINMSEWADYYGQVVKEALDSGDVVAIDGTPLIPHQKYLTQQVYACAIGSLTSREPLNLKAKLVKVKAELDDDNVEKAIDEIEELSQSTSWPTAFMEYQEREFAFKNTKANFVLIDGSLLPQNLITRQAGRVLFKEMLLGKNRRCYVGVQKNITGNNTERRFLARALKTGELYIHETLASFLKRYDVGDMGDFLDTVGVHIFRGVFKPGRKAFGFECHRDDLPYVVALLYLDANNVPGFEIPFLLAQVDAQLRGRYRPSEAVSAIEATLARYGEDDFFDEANERTFR